MWKVHDLEYVMDEAIARMELLAGVAREELARCSSLWRDALTMQP